jgi:hypothetical protein
MTVSTETAMEIPEIRLKAPTTRGAKIIYLTAFVEVLVGFLLGEGDRDQIASVIFCLIFLVVGYILNIYLAHRRREFIREEIYTIENDRHREELLLRYREFDINVPPAYIKEQEDPMAQVMLTSAWKALVRKYLKQVEKLENPTDHETFSKALNSNNTELEFYRYAQRCRENIPERLERAEKFLANLKQFYAQPPSDNILNV